MSQRIMIGLISVAMIAFGAILNFANDGDNNSLSGILMRVGFMLAAVWLAYPKLIQKDSQNVLAVVGILLVVVILFAAKPKIAVGALAIGAIVLVINWFLKRLSKKK